MKVLDKKSLDHFLEMDFRKDKVIHDPDWYMDRVPASFYKEQPVDIKTISPFQDYDSFRLHSKCMDHGFYCKPSWDWISPMAVYLEGKKVLDTMTGNGLIPLCLKHLGIDIDACDRSTGKDNNYVRSRSWDFPIISGEMFITIQAGKGKIYDTIMLIWPEYAGDGSDKKICDTFLDTNPMGEIIFIGEGPGGCTGSDEFFESYDIEPLEEVDQYYIPAFGIYDGIYKAKKYRG